MTRAEETNCVYCRELESGDEILVIPMNFSIRLTIGPAGMPYYSDAYCYHDLALALVAPMWTGEGDPLDGWHRHINSGRRREGGDPSKETVRK